MPYEVRNDTTGVTRRFPTEAEARQDVNETASTGDEWVIKKLPERGVGAGPTVASGVGPTA
jgi:hypothetical protein